MSLEVHTTTRGDYRPDPDLDPIVALFYSIFHDIPPESGSRHVTGVICVHPESARQQEVAVAKELSRKRMEDASVAKGRDAPVAMDVDDPQPSTSKQDVSTTSGRTSRFAILFLKCCVIVCSFVFMKILLFYVIIAKEDHVLVLFPVCDYFKWVS